MPIELLTISEIAATLKLSPRTIHAWIADGRLPHPTHFNNKVARFSTQVVAEALMKMAERFAHTPIVAKPVNGIPQ